MDITCTVTRMLRTDILQNTWDTGTEYSTLFLEHDLDIKGANVCVREREKRIRLVQDSAGVYILPKNWVFYKTLF